MFYNILKSKIHRATVTDANLNYEGSITVYKGLLEEAGILPHEQVDVLNINNGARFTTYTIESESQGEICINGAAARLVQTGDLVIICAYQLMKPEDAKVYKPKVILVNEKNLSI